MEKFYITTSIAYPNAAPHIGYALELAQADFLARYYQLVGREVYFLTGLDEHGLKIQRAAEKAGVGPKIFVDEKAALFQRLVSALNMTPDRFIRTSDIDHQSMSQALWKLCEKRGDIYKKTYRAWYNVKEEEFLGLDEEGTDPSSFGIDQQYIELIDEVNYFFKLSKYEKDILELLKTGKIKITPTSRGQELVNFIEQKGLQDISISRERSKLEWGVLVPGDDTQVMYVWFDALTNYLTAVCSVDGQGIKNERGLWPADLHVIGKDISRFHGLIWPGMLLSAGIELPKEILIHGFLTSGGQKMSKSLGNVVDPLVILEKFPVDAVRWYLLKEVPTTGDADFTEDRLGQVFLADLANDLGNLVSRIWTMGQKYSVGKVPQVASETGRSEVGEAWGRYHQAVHDRTIHEALTATHDVIVFCNRLIDEKKPWQMAKDPAQAEQLQELLYTFFEIVRHISIMIEPAMPETAEKISSQLFAQLPTEVNGGFEKDSWALLPTGHPLGSQQVILFPKGDVGGK